MSTQITPSMETKPRKSRKPAARREGERFRLALVKADARLSFSISPSATGYTLRVRRTEPDSGTRTAVEHFAEAQYGDSFSAAKKRVIDFCAAAVKDRGWTEKKRRLAIEDLL